MDINTIIIFFSAFSFLFYGVTCLTTQHMQNEFIRFGLETKRPLAGILQVLGGIGLILGYYLSPVLVFLSSGGLAVLMLLGLGVRIKIKDSILASFPAFFYTVLNSYISIYYLILLGSS